MNTSDLLSAVSYALRMEVQIHSIVSGSAFTALLKFVRLLESVSLAKAAWSSYAQGYFRFSLAGVQIIISAISCTNMASGSVYSRKVWAVSCG